jgi:diguanylate cyclase (GGDEF)-like protein
MLVVDDSPSIHKLIRAHLASEPVRIHSAYDGESGLSKAQAIQPNLVLMDMDMPGMKGLEVCRRLKASPRTADVPVIFVTIDCSTNDKVKAFEMGAVDYITKPFAADEIRARVKAALRDVRGPAPTVFIEPLTGLWNQEYLEHQMHAQLSLAQRTRLPVSLTIGQIDSLQSIYEECGRPAADQITRSIAKTWNDLCRDEDVLCHLGGGRLVSLQPATTGTQGLAFARTALAAITHQLFLFNPGAVRVTCSLGVAESRQWEGSLLQAAEQALFDARLAGGNRVVLNEALVSRADALRLTN